MSIIEAASVLVTRTPGSSEVYLVVRSPALRFMGGMVAFPGGKVHSSDEDVARPDHGLNARHVCAIRELFEETGVLLAHLPDGSFPPASPQLDRLRQALLDGGSFTEMLASTGLHLDPADLTGVGHLVTPPFAPMRFDTAFYVASLPPGQEAIIWPGELVAGLWASPAAALGQWQQGDLLLSPPTVSILQTIRDRPVTDLPARFRPVLDELDRGRMPAIWLNPGVLMIPLDCQGLAPTTHTNAFLVGTGPFYLIDPGPKDPVEQQKLFDVLSGRTVDAIVLTHHHPDHVGAAVVCARRFGVPILAHARTADLLRGRVPVDRLIGDGETLDLGEAPHGRGRWSMRAIFTPGHAPGHLAFHEPSYGLLFAGDMVSTLSSMIISPEDGDLAQYVTSLVRLKGYPTRLLLPAHGGASTTAARVLDEAIAHRQTREKQLLEALKDRPRSLDDLAAELYRGFPEAVIRLARLQIHAGLIKLEREGRARLLGADRWQL